MLSIIKHFFLKHPFLQFIPSEIHLPKKPLNTVFPRIMISELIIQFINRIYLLIGIIGTNQLNGYNDIFFITIVCCIPIMHWYLIYFTASIFSIFLKYSVPLSLVISIYWLIIELKKSIFSTLQYWMHKIYPYLCYYSHMAMIVREIYWIMFAAAHMWSHQ